MIPFIRLAALVRNARSAFASAQYLDAVNYAVDALSLLGFDAEATRIKSLIADVTNSDARAIAVDVLGLVADVFGLVFSQAEKITVSAACEVPVETRLDHVAATCDKHAAPTTGAADTTGAVDPATVLLIVQVAQQVFSFFWDRYQKKQTA